ncbi:hypothetical protein ACJ73_06980, partial [Blastomyces percursus]
SELLASFLPSVVPYPRQNKPNKRVAAPALPSPPPGQQITSPTPTQDATIRPSSQSHRRRTLLGASSCSPPLSDIAVPSSGIKSYLAVRGTIQGSAGSGCNQPSISLILSPTPSSPRQLCCFVVYYRGRRACFISYVSGDSEMWLYV